MSSDKNFWKNEYQEIWASSSAREIQVAQIIEAETKSKLIKNGLGAESTEFISGSASDNGYLKGDADYSVKGTNIFIEVTGPLVKSVTRDQPLWFRPDMISNAIQNIKIHDTWLVHHLPQNNELRTIHVDTAFIQAYRDGQFNIRQLTIRGNQERFVEFLSNSKFVSPINLLYEKIMNSL